MEAEHKGMLIGGLASAAIFLGYLGAKSFTGKPAEQPAAVPEDKHVELPPTPVPVEAVHEEHKAPEPQVPVTILLGDVGGTNVRLWLKRVHLHDPESPSETIKEGNYLSQKVPQFEYAISEFLQVTSFS